MTSLHAAAKMKNTEILEFLAENIFYKNSIDKLQWMDSQYKDRYGKEYTFNIHNNSVLSMISGEDTLYKESFIKVIKDYAKWENQFILNLRKTKQSNKNVYIDQ